MGPTPLYDALRAFAGQDALRMHMPGHKGKPLPAPELAGLAALDVTELGPTGDLFAGGGPIGAAEALWAARFRRLHPGGALRPDPGLRAGGGRAAGPGQPPFGL